MTDTVDIAFRGPRAALPAVLREIERANGFSAPPPPEAGQDPRLTYALEGAARTIAERDALRDELAREKSAGEARDMALAETKQRLAQAEAARDMAIATSEEQDRTIAGLERALEALRAAKAGGGNESPSSGLSGDPRIASGAGSLPAPEGADGAREEDPPTPKASHPRVAPAPAPPPSARPSGGALARVSLTLFTVTSRAGRSARFTSLPYLKLLNLLADGQRVRRSTLVRGAGFSDWDALWRVARGHAEALRQIGLVIRAGEDDAVLDEARP
jgi:hypothetical protein